MKKMRAKWLILCMTVVMALLFLQEDRVQAAQSKLMHISTGKVTIEEGKKWYIDLQNVPLGAKVKGISNDEQVATWKDGIIYGVKSGTTSIVVKVSYQEQNKKKTKKYPIKVTVIPPREKGMLQADTQEKYVYLRTAQNLTWVDEDSPYESPVKFQFAVSADNRILSSSVQSGDENIIAAQNVHVYNALYDSELTAYVKGAGTTALTFRDKYKKEYEVQVHVLPYENPIKSIKITNLENGVDLAHKLDQRADYAGEQQRGLTFTKKTKRPQVSVTAADGWIITGGYVDAYWGSYQKFTNVNAADWQFRMKGTAAKGFSDLFLVVNLQNKLTGATQSVSLGYYPYE